MDVTDVAKDKNGINEMKYEIHFNQDYYKLNVLGKKNKAKLLQSIPIYPTELSEDFIDYDTRYKGGQYKLATVRLILLIFKAKHGIFTTLRTWEPEKQRYYQMAHGKIFDIILTNS